MNKLVLVSFGAIVVAISYASIYMPDSILPYIINPSESWNVSRLILVFVLVAYGAIEMSRRRPTQLFMRALGVVLIGFCAIILLSPEIIGLSDVYLLPIDFVILVEGGIAALLLSLDSPLHESAYRSNRAFDANYYHSWLNEPANKRSSKLGAA